MDNTSTVRGKEAGKESDPVSYNLPNDPIGDDNAEAMMKDIGIEYSDEDDDHGSDPVTKQQALNQTDTNKSTNKPKKPKSKQSKKITHAERWDARFTELRAFHAHYGHCRVPHKYPPNPSLGIWVTMQRTEYRKLQCGVPNTSLTPAKMEALEELKFDWQIHKNIMTWDDRLEELKEYIREHGDAKVPSWYIPNPSLGRWCATQRVNYNKGKLSREKVAKLEGVGFVWKWDWRRRRVAMEGAKGSTAATNSGGKAKQAKRPSSPSGNSIPPMPSALPSSPSSFLSTRTRDVELPRLPNSDSFGIRIKSNDDNDEIYIMSAQKQREHHPSIDVRDGDRILSINGLIATGKSFDEVIALVRGTPRGDTLRLKLAPSGNSVPPVLPSALSHEEEGEKEMKKEDASTTTRNVALSRLPGSDSFELQIQSNRDELFDDGKLHGGIYVVSALQQRVRHPNLDIQDGDRILEVNGVPTGGKSFDEVIALVQGTPHGEKVRLKLSRDVAAVKGETKKGRTRKAKQARSDRRLVGGSTKSKKKKSKGTINKDRSGAEPKKRRNKAAAATKAVPVTKHTGRPSAVAKRRRNMAATKSKRATSTTSSKKAVPDAKQQTGTPGTQADGALMWLKRQCDATNAGRAEPKRKRSKTATKSKRPRDAGKEDAEPKKTDGRQGVAEWQERKWHDRLQELHKYKAEYGDTNVPYSSSSLGRWVTVQRMEYRKMQQGKPSNMTEERMNALSAIGFQWVGEIGRRSKDSTATFYQRLNELKQYKMEHGGDTNVPRTYDKDLSDWVRAQREEYQKMQEWKPTKLTEARVIALNEVGFAWIGLKIKEVKDDDKKEEKTKKRKKKRSACIAEDDGPNPKKRNRKSNEERWEEHLGKLRQYKAEHGDANVPQKYPSNPALGTWVKQQRQQYRKMQEGKPSSLTPARVAALEEVGFAWKNASWEDQMKVRCTELWQDRLEELRQYKAQHGNCNVPSVYEPNTKLAHWVRAQRKYYNESQQGKPSRLTEEMIEELKEVGFIFDSVRHPKRRKFCVSAWYDKLEELRQYHSEHGNCNVPTWYEPNPSLGRWVQQQRRQYNKMLEGEDSYMTEERVEALNKVGFQWKSRKGSIYLFSTS